MLGYILAFSRDYKENTILKLAIIRFVRYYFLISHALIIILH